MRRVLLALDRLGRRRVVGPAYTGRWTAEPGHSPGAAGARPRARQLAAMVHDARRVMTQEQDLACVAELRATGHHIIADLRARHVRRLAAHEVAAEEGATGWEGATSAGERIFAQREAASPPPAAPARGSR